MKGRLWSWCFGENDDHNGFRRASLRIPFPRALPLDRNAEEEGGKKDLGKIVDRWRGRGGGERGRRKRREKNKKKQEKNEMEMPTFAGTLKKVVWWQERAADAEVQSWPL